MDHTDLESNLGITRRSVIRRGAIVGGTLLWAAPLVQSFGKPALAQGSANCVLKVRRSVPPPGCYIVGECRADSACCDCIDQGGRPEQCPCQNGQDCHAVDPPQQVPC